MKKFKNIFNSYKETNKVVPENKSNNSSETFLEVFHVNDLPIKDRDSKVYFDKYFHLDGEWIEEGETLCKLTLMLDISSNDLPAASIKMEALFNEITIKSTRSGVLELKLENEDLLTDGTVLCKIHPKGQYLTDNTPENFEYKEFFKEPDHHLLFDRWLVQDGAYVKSGDPIFHYNDYENGHQTCINYSKKEGFIHQNQLGPHVVLKTNELMYIIRDTDEKRIEKRFENKPDIIIDEFTNSTIINWLSVSTIWPESGINTKSDDYNTDFIFSFNYINGGDHIVFHFNPKQIRPTKFDKVQFLFENEKQIQFDLVTNPIQSKNLYNKNILEYKCIITQTELDLFATSNFRKWKISLDSDNRDVLGGEIGNDGTYYRSKQNVQIAIKKFANDYIDLVKSTIPDYQPMKLKEISEYNKTLSEFCFVYLMHDTSNDYYKIGISNNPEYRESTLQSEKPTIEMIISKKFPVRKIAESIEKALHETYSEKRLRGEWFELDFIDVEHIKQTLS